MLFEWDEDKNKINMQKHGLDFEDAKYVFMDENKYEIVDVRKDYGEIRIITVGMKDDKLLTSVCHTDRNGVTRIISFRPASKKEKNKYYRQNGYL